MGVLVWAMMGIAIWHFTVFLPDRFWGGIIGVFLASTFGAVLSGLLISGFHVPGNDDLKLLTAIDGAPGALLAIAASYLEGSRRGEEPV